MFDDIPGIFEVMFRMYIKDVENFKDGSHSFELSKSPPSYAFPSPFLYFLEAATGVVL